MNQTHHSSLFFLITISNLIKQFSSVAIFFLVLLLCSTTSSFARLSQKDTVNNSESKKRIYTTTRLATDKPVIDGILNDECWKTGIWAGDFIQWIPKEGAKPSQPTEIKILYDDKNIYVAVRAFDEPEKISRKAGRRDEFQGDMVGINLDSYHDYRTGFEFNVTAAGQKTDLILTNPSNADLSWDAVWYVEVGMEDSAWIAEYEIPLSQLRYSGDYEQVWGLHFWRWIDRLQEESDWEPQSSTGPGILYLFGELHGIKGLPQSRRIEIMPYTVGQLKTFKSEENNPFANDGKSWFGNFGVDGKIGLSSNFTANLTLNPDFGQVESDPSVMNLTAFETFYDEKRPFFLEGKNIFGFDFDGNNIFYSRRIGHTPDYNPDLKNNEYIDFPDQSTIISAVKVSGKTSDGLSIGVLQSLTANEKAEINTPEGDREMSVEPLTNYAMARLQKDFDQGNTILGGIFTSTNRFINDDHLRYMNRNAFTGGFDFLHHLNDKEFYADAKLVGSIVSGSIDAIQKLQNSSARYYMRPDADHLEFDSTSTQLSGFGGRLKIGKGSKGFWRYSAEFNWRSPGLELNDLGFMQVADIVKQQTSVSYFVNQPVSIFRTFTIGINQVNNWDFGMNHLSSGAELYTHFEFLNKWATDISFGYTSEALDTRILRGGYAMFIPGIWTNELYIRTDPSEKIVFQINTDLSISEENNSIFYEIEPEISVMPMNTLKISVGVEFSYHRNDLQYVNTKVVNDESKYLLGKINQNTFAGTFRIDYNITPEFSIQYYGSPFASTGEYSEFKDVVNPRADEYSNRFTVLNPELNGNIYYVKEENYTFENPDFNFGQFRSNLVFRWEYQPGSQIFLVWSNEKTYSEPGYNSVNNTINHLKDVHPNNLFLIKFSYWLDI